MELLESNLVSLGEGNGELLGLVSLGALESNLSELEATMGGQDMVSDGRGGLEYR